jgi:Ca-activated chloride channel homolog
MRYIIFILLILGFIHNNAFSQNANDKLREGNKYFDEKKYNDAEISYKKSLELDPKSYRGSYNLGGALYKQKNYEDAVLNYSQLANRDIDKDTKSKIYHNLGNSYLQANKYKESIDAYKMALKSNPKDVDTKYNLEYAKKMMQAQQQQQKQQQQNQNQQQNQDQKQSQQNQQKEKQDQKQKQDEQKQQQSQGDQKQQKDGQQKQQKEQQQKMSKEDAERILQALHNNEKDLQKKMQVQKREKTKYSKNW